MVVDEGQAGDQVAALAVFAQADRGHRHPGRRVDHGGVVGVDCAATSRRIRPKESPSSGPGIQGTRGGRGSGRRPRRAHRPGRCLAKLDGGGAGGGRRRPGARSVGARSRYWTGPSTTVTPEWAGRRCLGDAEPGRGSGGGALEVRWISASSHATTACIVTAEWISTDMTTHGCPSTGSTAVKWHRPRGGSVETVGLGEGPDDGGVDIFEHPGS